MSLSGGVRYQLRQPDKDGKFDDTLYGHIYCTNCGGEDTLRKSAKPLRVECLECGKVERIAL